VRVGISGWKGRTEKSKEKKIFDFYQNKSTYYVGINNK